MFVEDTRSRRRKDGYIMSCMCLCVSLMFPSIDPLMDLDSSERVRTRVLLVKKNHRHPQSPYTFLLYLSGRDRQADREESVKEGCETE